MPLRAFGVDGLGEDDDVSAAIVYGAEQGIDVINLSLCLATNSIGGEMMNASLAVSDGEIFIRTHQRLWCIADMTKP